MDIIHNTDPNVINDELIRACIQLEGSTENTEDKRRQTDFREVVNLSFSFRCLQVINNLLALDNLTKLQLDNNNIQKIENIDHLVHLTWLDLSFNRITKVEGLSTLTQLTDLSLHSNQITVMENMETLKELNVFSIGNNLLRQMENIMYLRQFRQLRLVNLAGNPVCADPEYHNYVLSHIPTLTYLDYRLVDQALVQAAREQYQDEMLELEEADSKREEDATAATSAAQHDALMAEANLKGVESLFDDMLREDPEYTKLAAVKGLTDVTEFREKYGAGTEEFKAAMLKLADEKREERALYQTAVDTAKQEKDHAARQLIQAFEKRKKHAFRDVRDDPSRAEQVLAEPKARNEKMRDELNELEMQTVELMDDLNQEFERLFQELVDSTKQAIATYFSTIRDLEIVYFEAVTANALRLMEEYASGKIDPDEYSDDARALLADKDTLMNAIQASHDAHTSKIDATEDGLVQNELKRFNDTVLADKAAEHKRNRDRVNEICNLIDRNRAEIEEMLVQEEADA